MSGGMTGGDPIMVFSISVYNLMLFAAGDFSNAGGTTVNNIARWSTPTGIVPIGNNVPNEFSLHQNYPNPFNPATRIKFDIPVGGLTKLRIYDNLGKTVSEPLNEQLAKGSYEITFDASNLSSGIYYYELSSGSYRKTMKMILAK
jgi:hypothetical protein